MAAVTLEHKTPAALAWCRRDGRERRRAMEVSIVAGSANPVLAEAVASALGARLASRIVERFPDSEVHVEILESMRGKDVYLLQPTSPPVDEHLLELLFLADACRRAGAARSTAVIPYSGYARQDRRARGREPVGARVVADMLGAAGISRIVAVELHSPALEGFFALPLEHLSAVPLLADAARPWMTGKGVVVAPDLGAAKLADRYARILDLPVAIVHKTRLGGDAVSVHRITGEVRDRAPLIVDDMISTGGTIEAAIKALREAGCAPDITVVASHGLFVGPARQRLSAAAARRYIVTDSVPSAEGTPLPVQVVSVSGLLAETIRRLHDDRSLGELIAHR
jgi:ribose-phosphate pyrophosphokinase